MLKWKNGHEWYIMARSLTRDVEKELNHTSHLFTHTHTIVLLQAITCHSNPTTW